jgi:hypothetical protein
MKNEKIEIRIKSFEKKKRNLRYKLYIIDVGE